MQARIAVGPRGLAPLFVLVLLAALASCGKSTPTSPSAVLITVQPTDQTAVEGADATFTVVASNASGYQWQRSTNGGVSFGNLSGATSATLTRTAVSIADDGHQFRVVVSNAAGSVTSNAAMLTVTPAPVAPAFTQHPQDVSVTEGQNAQMTVVVTGNPSPTVQWQSSTDGGTVWNDIGGATGTTLDIFATSLSDDGRKYRAVADNGVGAPVISNSATLTVTAATPPLGITTTSPLPIGAMSTPYSVTLAASGGTPPYVWSLVGGSLPASMTLSAAGVISGTPTQSGSFNFTVHVDDSSIPSQSDEVNFDLGIQPPCDLGYGELTVAGAPSTVGGRFCPGIQTGPSAPNSSGFSTVGWVESNPPVVESIYVQYYPTTGTLLGVTYNLNDPTRSWSLLCTGSPNPNYPTCTGVTIDQAMGTVRFTDTVVSASASFTLNGELRF